MDILSYRKKHSLSQAGFARLLTENGCPATQAVVSMWERKEVQLPAERCVEIERVTGGEIRRVDLRPDLFGTVTPVPPVAADDVEAAA